MNVWLDPKAPNAESEYAIRHDPDYFGKIVFKNFCRAVLNISNSDLEIPLPKANQEIRGLIGDARVHLRAPRLRGDLNVEIKLSHLHRHKTAGDNWAFTNIFRTEKANQNLVSTCYFASDFQLETLLMKIIGNIGRRLDSFTVCNGWKP